MRVGLVCPYSLAVPGGVQNHVLGLAAALDSRGHDVSVLAPGVPSGAPSYVVSAGRAVPVPYNGAVGRISFGPAVAARVGRWLAGGGFDVVHVHEPLTPSIALLAVRAADVPVVATFHTAQDRPRGLAASARALRPWLGRIDWHVAVSPEAARTLQRYLPVSPTVVPNGIDVAAYTGPGRRDGRTLVFLGRTDERRKGLGALLEAWPAIRRARPDAHLLVAGPGRGPVPASAPGVHRLGTLTEPAKRALLRRADVLVAPNTHGESFGLVIAEAMAAGATVLARDLRSFRDVLDHGRCGALFTDDLVEQAVGLLDNPDRRVALSAAARAHVRRFDWSRVLPPLEAAYSRLATAPEATAS